MPPAERVTVTLPRDVLREIERVEKNRSRFVLEAVRRELQRRRREALRLSLRNPHPDREELADAGFDDWASSLPDEDSTSVVDMASGTPVRWVPGEGWLDEIE